MSSRTPGHTKSYKVVHYPVNHTPCKFIQAQRICKNTLPNVKKMQESIVQQTRWITHSTNKIKHNKRESYHSETQSSQKICLQRRRTGTCIFSWQMAHISPAAIACSEFHQHTDTLAVFKFLAPN